MSAVHRAARVVQRFTEQLELAVAVGAGDVPAARRRRRARRPRLSAEAAERKRVRALAQVFAEPLGDLPAGVAKKLEQLRWSAAVYPGACTPEGFPPPVEKAFEVRRTTDGVVLAEGSSVADAADKAHFLWRAR